MQNSDLVFLFLQKTDRETIFIWVFRDYGKGQACNRKEGVAEKPLSYFGPFS